MARPQLAKAVLIPMNGDQPESDQSQYILVQFNPGSLRLGLSNSLKADNSGGSTPTAAQYIEKSESTLTVQLVFDTTVARDVSQNFKDAEGADRTATAEHAVNSDVRKLTKAIADKFMQPQNPAAERPSAPLRCRFQWGAFAFVGMLGSYDETLDFFSPEGIPLRATLALTFKEDRYQFETLNVTAAERAQPTISSGGADVSAANATANSGSDPKNWRDVAMYNGMENPRLSTAAGLAIPGARLGIGASATLGAANSFSASFGGGASGQVVAETRLGASSYMGFSAGESAALGTDIPGAFGSGSVKASARLAVGLKVKPG